MAVIAIPAPAFEGEVVLANDFALEAGGVLRAPTLRYSMYGQLNAARDNAVLVCHALSGSSQVAEWWPQLFAPGGLLVPERDCVVCVNILGSCYGSTGPSSIDPQTGEAYGASFPLVHIRDIVRSQAELLDRLGIARLRLVIGASIGGMQALEWAIQYPERVEHTIAIGAAPLGAMGLALNHLQRQAIMLDPAWQGGNYAADHPPLRGLALARALAVCSYKSEQLFEERFARKANRAVRGAAGEDPYAAETPEGAASGLSGGRFDVAGYLDYQGERFNDRFDANSYLAITRTMDTFEPARGYGSAADAYARIRARVTLLGISSDWLFPPRDILGMAEEMRAAGVVCDYREMESDHGHDAFLAEPEELVRLLRDRGKDRE
jgi:homoserine O-acetyltransferase